MNKVASTIISGVISLFLVGSMAAPAFADEAHADTVAIHVVVNDDERNTLTHVQIDDELDRVFAVRADGVPCWVRLRTSILLSDDNMLSDIHGTEWGENWIEKPDGWAYYKTILNTDASTSVDSEFAVRDIVPHMTNGDTDFSEVVSAEAIQSDGHEPDFDADEPWSGMYDDDNPPASSDTITGPNGSTTTDTPMPITGTPLDNAIKALGPLGTRLAQTGDLLAPVIAGLTCILAFSVIMLVLLEKKEKKEAKDNTQGD